MLPKLLYLHPQSSTFIRKDINFLSHHFAIREHGFLLQNKALLPRMFLRQLLFLALHLPSASKVIVMFGGYHSFLPALMAKLFRKKCFIILGGTDCTSYPSIDYGTFRKPFQGMLTGWSYKLSEALLPVHRSLMGHENTYYTEDGVSQGCQAFVSSLFTPSVEIFNGYDANQWSVGSKLPNSFVSVGYFDSKSRMRLKGCDLIQQVASDFPQCMFTIVGVADSSLVRELPNLRVLNTVGQVELKELFAQHRFYLQLSISEGFPNAICEAMLSGCIPIGSNVNGIPEIIGDTGLVLLKRDLPLLCQVIQQAIAMPHQEEQGLRARKRISERFTIEARESKMLQVLMNGVIPMRQT